MCGTADKRVSDKNKINGNMIKIKTFESSNDWDSLPRIRAQSPAGFEVSLAVGNGAESL